MAFPRADQATAKSSTISPYGGRDRAEDGAPLGSAARRLMAAAIVPLLGSTFAGRVPATDDGHHQRDHGHRRANEGPRRSGLQQEIHAGAAHRIGRHGDGLRGHASERSSRRHQDPAWRRLGQRRPAGALPSRGVRREQGGASGRRSRTRRRHRGGRVRLPRDGPARGRDARRPQQAPRGALAGSRGLHARLPGARRARGGARQGRRSTATSSRRTCFSRSTACSRCSTSAWRACCWSRPKGRPPARGC